MCTAPVNAKVTWLARWASAYDCYMVAPMHLEEDGLGTMDVLKLLAVLPNCITGDQHQRNFATRRFSVGRP